ncbi:MAG: YceI family protein [Flavobacteriales bacterium]|jgi:polyisoprenoid-binding protein YceI|nr:YceI family protein [Flavobacteriales bacterium]
MKSIKIISLIALLNLMALGAFGQKEIDLENSKIEFSIDNSGTLVKGKFVQFSGTVTFNPDELDKASFEVKIPVSGIRSGNSIRDKHLNEEDFFFADKFPSITFKSSLVEKTAKGYMLSGELSMRGVSKKIKFPFTYADETFKGRFVINRKNYGVGDEGYDGEIAPEVKISIRCKLKS